VEYKKRGGFLPQIKPLTQKKMGVKTVEAGEIAGKARDYGFGLIKDGVRVIDVAEAVECKIKDLGADVAFPCNICINEVAAHYTPCIGDDLTFDRGMLVKLDCGAHIDGFIGDTAVSKEIGGSKYEMLIQASKEALKNVISVVKDGITFSEIGMLIENTISDFGFRTIRNLMSHSVEEYKLHGTSIPNASGIGYDGVLKEGDVVAIEPFATDGAGFVVDRKNSNIYDYKFDKPIGNKKAMDLLSTVKDWKLPFAERWCGIDKPKFPLIKLVRNGNLHMYPIFVERSGGMVAQTEHTLYVGKDDCQVTTL